MRIIGGKFGGLRLNPPQHLPVRPTTDLAKEALFNILQHQLDFNDAVCLDLFSGTGNISFELASRGASRIDAVDAHFKCLQYIEATAKKMNIAQIHTTKSDVFRFLQRAGSDVYDFIFADPPYDLPALTTLPELIFANNLLKEDGLFVLEHPSTRQLNPHPGFVETRKYGYSSFSFYKKSML